MTPAAAAGAPGREVPRRPWTLWLAYVGIGLESACLLFAALFSVGLGIKVGTEASALIALSVMLGVMAAAQIATLVALVRGRRWARPASVAWQVLLTVSGLSMLGQNPLLAAGALIPAAVVLVGIFAPASLRWYDIKLALAEEAAGTA